MTDYTVAVAKHATLAAGITDSVTLTDFSYDTGSRFQVFNHGATEWIWFTTNGTTPVAHADNTYFAKPGTGRTVPCRQAPGANDQVKLVCAAAVDYSVTGSS